MPRSLRDYLLARSPAVPAAPQQPALTDAQIDDQNAAAYRQNEAQTSPFVSGLDEGVTNLEGSGQALLGLTQGALGDVQGGRARLRRAGTLMQQAQDYSTPETSDLATAYKSGNLARYAQHQLGSLTPGIAATVIPAAVTGGVGGLAQAGLRRLAVGAAEDVAEGAAKKAATNVIGRTIGEQIGAIGSGTAQMAGTTAGAVDPNASDDDFQAQSKKALVGAGALGTLQAIPGLALMHRYGLGAAAESAIAKRVGAPLLQRIATEAGEQGAIGGATGVATVKAEHAIHDYITGQDSAAPALPDYVNALASGTLGGAVFGAPAGLHGAAPDLAGFTKRATALRTDLEQRFKARAADRPKPGEEIPLDGGKSPAQHFDENLAAVRDDQPLDGKAFGISKDNTLNGPAASLVDPARTKARATSYDAFGLKSPTEQTVASILNDDQYTADAVPGIKASAKAIRKGWDNLNEKEKGAVSDFAGRLGADQRKLFANALATSDQIVKRSAGLTDSSEIPSFRKTSPDAVDTEAPASLQATEKAPDLSYVDPDTWSKAQYFKKAGGPERGTPDEENVRMIRFNKDGESYRVDFNMKQAASSLAKTEEGRSLLASGEGPSRKVKAVMGVLTEALNRDTPIPRDSIREGLRVFPGDDGVLNAKEAAYIQKAMKDRYQGTPGIIETKGRANPTKTLDLPQSDEVQTAEGDLSARQDDQYKLGPDPTKVRGEERAIETTARKGAEAAGVATFANGQARHPGAIYEDLLRRPDSNGKRVALGAIRRLSETDPSLADHISAADDKLAARDARIKAKSAPEAPKAPETLKTLEAEVGPADQYARNPPKDFTAAEARKRAQRMVEIAQKAASKRDALGEDHPAYQRLDDLRMNAKDAAEALRHAAEQQEAAEKLSPEQYKADSNLHTNNASGESSASIEAINRLRDEKAAGQSRMLVDRDGSVRPLFGVDAVDTFARPGQIIVQRGVGREPWTVISDGTGSRELAQGKLNAARAKLEAEHADLMSDYDKNVPAGDNRAKEPIREAVERVKATEGFKKVAKLVDQVKTAGNDRIKERQLVNRLSKAFGVDAPVVTEHVGGAPGKISTDGKVISLDRNLKGAQRLSALFHEFGHHLFESKWASADEATKSALEADYQKWLKANQKKTSSFEVRASRAPFFTNERILDALGGERSASMKELDASKVNYLLSRDEYFADSIARALEQHEGVQGLVGKFFAKLAQALKLTYDLLRGAHPELADTPAAVKDWVHSLWSAQDSDLASSAAERSAPEFRTAAGDAPSAAFNSPSDTSTLLSPEDRGVLGAFMLRKGTMEQLLEGASPDEARQLMNFGSQLDAAVNRGFALWASGKLKLVDKRTLAVLHELRDVVKKTFGFATDKDVAERVLADLKAGTYNPKESTRHVLDNASRADMRARANAGSDTAKIELAIHKAVSKTTSVVGKKLGPVYDRVLNDLDHRIRATNIPALRQLAGIVHRQTGEIGEGETLSQAITRQRAQFWDRAVKLGEGLDLRGQARVLKALRTKTTLSDPALEAKRQAISDFLNKDMRRYLTDAGVDFGKIDDYFPVVVDPTKVQNREADFRALLSDPKLKDGMAAYFKSKGWDVGTMSQTDMVNAMYRMAASEFDYSNNGISFADGILPSGREFRTRVSEFIYRTGDQDLINKFAKFQSGNLEQTLIPYITHAVRRAESTRRLGKQKDMRVSTLDQLLAKAKEQGAKPQDIELAKDYINASLGSYGTGPNPFFQKVLGSFDRVFDTKFSDTNSAQFRKLSNALIAYQNLRVLGLGLFGNLIDPLGVWARTSSAGQTWEGYKAAAKAAFSKEGTYLSDMAHALGVVERHAVGEALAYNYGGTGDDLGALSHRINTALFKVNGMEMVTKFARLAATEAGNKFLLRHVNDPTEHSARYLKELGLEAADVVEDPQHPGYVKLSPKVEKALYQFVDEAVLRPSATQRPLWHNDPHFAVLAQYKGYLYSFYNTIVQRMLHEAGHGNFKGLMPIVGYLGVTLAVELAREMAQYGPGGNPRRKDWGVSEYTGLALDRSGLMGPRFSAVEDVAGDPERGNIPGQSITGPTVAQASELLKTVAGRRSIDSTAIHALPGQSIFKGWLSHDDSTGEPLQPGQGRALAGT